ncbi:hypothetical protein I3843_16G104300 [Carya illinoinensis]|uniref:DUF4220 domain-containing protein n=1 Tax=Carya illinoinensis TaxID=32201 RepID=A0A922D676_CARIL|nr:hypothetical protein I3842_16G103000 [Carya illinoinensis]KAG7942471.1 hypothetical protein I3843_16G104300 [Carya illinoinensis]
MAPFILDDDLVIHEKLPWDSWPEIEVLFFVNLALQIVLTFYGSRRKYIPGLWIRFTVLSAYLLSGSVAKIVIGKLAAISVRDYNLGKVDAMDAETLCKLAATELESFKHAANWELKLLLAPLILAQAGNPDTITAYSIEDDKLGLGQFHNLVIQVGVTASIILSFESIINWFSFLYMLLFLAGIIKYGEFIWALNSSLKNSGLSIKEIHQEADDHVPSLFRQLTSWGIPGLELILKAYCRFDCLKPHLENWLYKPFYESLPWMSIDAYSPEDIFKITDVELGFMYDVLYTKSPIIYSRTGCILRILYFLSLASTLCGLVILYLTKSLKDGHSHFCILVVLIVAAMILEVYQIILLPFSDWAIIQMIKHHNSSPVVMHCLRVLGPKSRKWKRWSHSLGQFNLLSFSLHDKQFKYCSKIMKFFGKEMEFKKSMSRSRLDFSNELKELIVEELKKVDNVRNSKPITKRGHWALERYGCPSHDFRWSVMRDFDKSITIWHLATDICYRADVQCMSTANRHMEMSKTLSNYMMYLLALRPQMLCATTADIIFEHALTKLKTFLSTTSTGLSVTREDEGEFCWIWMNEEIPKESDSSKRMETDVERLTRSLMKLENKWELMSSVWVEMLCYAASNCPLECHAEQLRRGGGLITHIWLLLAHMKT